MSIYRFIAFLLISAFAFLTFTNQDIVIKQTDNNLSLIEFNNFKLYNITKEGVLEFVKGSSANRFKDFDTITNIHLIKIEKGFIYTLKSNQATIKDEVYTLSSLDMIRDDGLKIKSSDVLYDSKNEIISCDKSFQIELNGSIFTGTNLIYDLNKHTILAKKIKATIRRD